MTGESRTNPCWKKLLSHWFIRGKKREGNAMGRKKKERGIKYLEGGGMRERKNDLPVQSHIATQAFTTKRDMAGKILGAGGRRTGSFLQKERPRLGVNTVHGALCPGLVS